MVSILMVRLKEDEDFGVFSDIFIDSEERLDKVVDDLDNCIKTMQLIEIPSKKAPGAVGAAPGAENPAPAREHEAIKHKKKG